MNLPSPAIPPPGALSARIGPVRPSFGGAVRLPGSKSITNRVLLMAALARGTSHLSNVLDCDDSRYMLAALERLGVGVSRVEDESRGEIVRLDGVGGPFPVDKAEIFAGNAGTTARFLTGALAASGGTYRVDGDARMRERPIGDLVRALSELGARVKAPTGCPPVEIRPGRLTGGDVEMPGRVSSQFISSVLMASVLALEPTRVRIVGELVSRPYLDLTVEGMREFGARVLSYDDARRGQPVFSVEPASGYRALDTFVEGDASGASYFYAAAALTGATVRVDGVGKRSRQGDLRCADVLAEMGCRVNKEPDAVTVTGGLLHGIDCDCSDIPDVVPTLAVVATFARGRTRLRGVAHLRHKESDRIASVARELSKLGVRVRERPDGLEVRGIQDARGKSLHGAEIDTWGDHRIAMAFSVIGLVVAEVVIRDPGVVTKSFPGFFDALASLGAGVRFSLRGGEVVELAAAAQPGSGA